MITTNVFAIAIIFDLVGYVGFFDGVRADGTGGAERWVREVMYRSRWGKGEDPNWLRWEEKVVFLGCFWWGWEVRSSSEEEEG